MRLKEGDPTGRHVVIVDDLIQSGSTIIECQKLLKALGARQGSGYATHGVFPKVRIGDARRAEAPYAYLRLSDPSARPQRSWERFKSTEEDGDGFSYVWITDSVSFTAEAVEGKKPFEVLSLARVIADTLQI